jgi:hypothetical protein
MNIPGWRTAKKYVVFESDDWGSIRTSSVSALEQLSKKGYPVFEGAYCKYDSLESNEDVSALFEVLASVKDMQGNPAVITANNIVANPDFEKIKASGYQQFYFEPFTDSYQKYPAHHRVFDLYQQGIKAGVFWPQYHGREHVNVSRWLKALQAQKTHVLDAFAHHMFSMHAPTQPHYFNAYMDAMDCDTTADLLSTSQIVAEGLAMFEKIWGFPSRSFIAPCYIWHTQHEQKLATLGVQYLQGLLIQQQPVLKSGTVYKQKYHFTGNTNCFGQRYLVRNAFFEPTPYPNTNWVDDCLYRIQTAFRWGKPAIVSTHRLNFIGHLYPENREKNLRQFKQLLHTITKKWPKVEFVSTDELGDIISGKPILRHTITR